MLIKEYLLKEREYHISELMRYTESYLEEIEKQNKKIFNKQSIQAKDLHSEVEFHLQLLKDTNRVLQEIEMVGKEEKYKQIHCLNILTLQLIINNIIDNSLIAKFILGVADSKERIFSAMAEGRRELVMEEIEGLRNVSEQELEKAKEEFLQVVIEVMEKRMSSAK